MKFEKYEGAGNDFILFDGRASGFSIGESFIAAICDRRYGIGADGVMILGNSLRAEFSMRYFNSDGREAAMCGNGGRCIAWFADRLSIGGTVKTFEARDGIHTAEIIARSGNTSVVRLRMQDVDCVRTIEGDVTVDTGVPHLVRMVDDFNFDVVAEGRLLRNSESLGPEGANINFVQPKGRGHFALRTYERGVEDETLACGTGATASAIAVNRLLQPLVNSFDIEARGGRLQVDFHTDDNNRYSEIFLTGSARMVFAGTLSEENFK